MMSRSIRAETRSRAKDDVKRSMHSIERVRPWEKRWVTIAETTMKIYKWVPVISSEQKKKKDHHYNKEHFNNKENLSRLAREPNFVNTEDSNGGFSTVSDTQSQGVTEFSSSNLGFSEDSNSQDSAVAVSKGMRLE